MTQYSSEATQSGAGGAVALIIVFAAIVYFLPSIIAIKRRVNIGPVVIINIFFGWSFIGWIVALINACAQRLVIEPIQINHYITVPPAIVGPQVTSPSGWYQDPSGPGSRFWDGTQWTPQVHA